MERPVAPARPSAGKRIGRRRCSSHPRGEKSARRAVPEQGHGRRPQCHRGGSRKEPRQLASRRGEERPARRSSRAEHLEAHYDGEPGRCEEGDLNERGDGEEPTRRGDGEDGAARRVSLAQRAVEARGRGDGSEKRGRRQSVEEARGRSGLASERERSKRARYKASEQRGRRDGGGDSGREQATTTQPPNT